MAREDAEDGRRWGARPREPPASPPGHWPNGGWVRREVRPSDPGPALPTLSGTREESVTCDDGVRLAVREIGPADAALTLVFAHGYTVTSECWAAQVRDLSRDQRPGGLRIVLYDQRGHGASEVR